MVRAASCMGARRRWAAGRQKQKRPNGIGQRGIPPHGLLCCWAYIGVQNGNWAARAMSYSLFGRADRGFGPQEWAGMDMFENWHPSAMVCWVRLSNENTHSWE